MASASMSMSLVSPPRGPRPRSRLLSPSSVAPPLSAFSRRACTSVIFSPARPPALPRIVCCSSAAVAVAVSNGQQQHLLSPSSVAPPLSAFSRRACTSVIFSPARPPALPRIVCCSSAAVAVAVSNGRPEVRLGLPSKGRMADDTLGFLKDCQMPVKLVNPRQCVTEIPQLSNLQALFERPEDTVDKLFSGDLDVGIVDSDTVSEHGLGFDTVSEHGRIILELSNLRVWFEQPEDIVEKLLSGDLDIGLVGFDTVSEHGQGNEDLIIVHEALDYGNCRLSLAIPKYGIFEKINSVKELAQMPQWTEEKPLRVTTSFGYLGPKFMKENGLKHVSFSNGEGALEGAPAMGTADVILDLVSSGTALRENNLKEIEGGTVLESQAVLVASRKSLIQREGVLGATREIIDRLEAHLKAVGQFMVTANMRGSSAEEVTERLLSQPSLSGGGLQGPTVPPVFRKGNGEYGIVICVPEEALNSTVQQLRAIGVSRVLVSPLTYSFDEESPRWQQLLSKLGL